ncbi:MAG: FeS-binding protein [Firmicutes bacterium]|nr:FeS-binding protein [Bacillota bacterium]
MRKLKNIQTQYFAIFTKNCKACWKCFENCPNDVFAKVNILGIHKHIKIKNANNCVGCKKCIKSCISEVFFEINKIFLRLLFYIVE